MKKNQVQARKANATSAAAPVQAPTSTAGAVPTPEIVPVAKRPRPDGQPGMEWAIPPGADLDPYLDAEGLECLVFKDPDSGRHGDLYERPDGSLVYLDDQQSPVLFRDVTPAEALEWYARHFLPTPLRLALASPKTSAAIGGDYWLGESHKDLSLGLPMPAAVALTYDTLIGILAETIFGHRASLARVLVIENPDDFQAAQNADVIRMAEQVSRSCSLATLWGRGATPKLPRHLSLAGMAGRRGFDTEDLLMCFAEFFHNQSDLIRRKLIDPADNYPEKLELAEALVIAEASIDHMGNLTELGDEDAGGRRTSSAQRLAWRIKAEHWRAELRAEQMAAQGAVSAEDGRRAA